MSDARQANSSSEGAILVAGPCPGCQGSVTVGTAQTGNPNASRANTADRFPTDPRTTWEETTTAAGLPPAGSDCSDMKNVGPEQIDHETDEENHAQYPTDPRTPDLSPFILVRITGRKVVFYPFRHPSG